MGGSATTEKRDTEYRWWIGGASRTGGSHTNSGCGGHAGWGLNDQIKSMAAELAKQGYLPLAIDLYRGKATADQGTHEN